jgi:hypothetical protein
VAWPRAQHRPGRAATRSCAIGFNARETVAALDVYNVDHHTPRMIIGFLFANQMFSMLAASNLATAACRS